jgi:EAL domain-containing protein (putative c-di-GMP-specific phosphodiesterase class I)
LNGRYKKDDVAITKTIISLAENLGLEIIAEGVETKAQLEFLLQEGCTQIQGFYYSKPLNVTEATEYLKRFKDKKVSPRFPSVFSYQI